MKTQLSISNLYDFLPSSLDDGSFEIYSGCHSPDLSEYCLPSPSSQSVTLFGPLYQTPKILYASKRTITPDLAIYSPSGEIILGCRDSAPLARVNKERTNIEIIDLDIKNFYATSFKYNGLGELFVGNLFGDPIILSADGPLTLPLNTNRSYDCLWLDNDNLLVSCMSEGRVVHCRRLDGTFRIQQELLVTQPYRFSPLLNGLVLLTTRGWHDRPGQVHIIRCVCDPSISFSVSLDHSINVSDHLFFIQKYSPKFILNLLRLQRYTGYINDVAWINSEQFIITTKSGGALLVYGIKGDLISKLSKYRSTFTRFIGTRLPGDPLFVIDTGEQPSFLEVLFTP